MNYKQEYTRGDKPNWLIKSWVDGNSWGNSDYLADGNKLYTCNMAGVQTGTFAENAGKWDVIKGASNILWSNDRYKTLLLTNSQLEYWDGSDVRLKINGASSSLYSPDQTAFIALNNGEFDVWLATERMSIDATMAHITSPDGNQSLVVDDTGVFYNGVELLTDSNPATDRIVSPDTISDLTISNINLLYSDGSYARLYIDNTESRLTSPGGQSTMSIKNGDFNFNDGTRDRIEVESTGTTISSDEGAQLLLIDDWFNFNDGTRTRLNIGNANAAMYSPDGSKYLNITNTWSKFIGDLNCGSNLIVDGNITSASPIVFKTTESKGYFEWRKESDNVRHGWLGFGSGGNYNFTIKNEVANSNIVIDATGTGIVYATSVFRAVGYQSADGTVGHTGTLGAMLNLIFKNGLCVGYVI